MAIGKDEKFYLKLLALMAFLLLLRFNSKIVLENRMLNGVIGIASFSLPFFLFISAFFIERAATKFFLILVSGLFSAVCFLFIFFSAADLVDLAAHDGKDSGFECINELPYEGSLIKVYRTNGGATTSFGIIVRKETRILPGILFVKQYLDLYPGDTVGIKIIDQNKLELKHTDMERNEVVITRVEI